MLSFETFSYLIHQNEYMNIFISTFVFQFIDQHLNFSFIVDNFTILAIVYWLGKGGNWNECKKYFWFVEFLEDSGIQVLKPFLFLHFPFSFHWHRRCSSNLQINFCFDDYDYISWLQAKAPLYLNLFNKASTFNPLGSLSSTEDIFHKNRQIKTTKSESEKSPNWSSTIENSNSSIPGYKRKVLSFSPSVPHVH